MTISTVSGKGRLIVQLTGELDQHEARETREKVEEQLDELLPRECALDLSGLRFMDSSGIAVILGIRRRMEELGGRLYLVNVPGQPRRVLEAAGIERLVPMGVQIKTEETT